MDLSRVECGEVIQKSSVTDIYFKKCHQIQARLDRFKGNVKLQSKRSRRRAQKEWGLKNYNESVDFVGTAMS